MSKTATLVRRLCCANCGSIRIDAIWPAYVAARVDVEAAPGLQPRDMWRTEITDETRPEWGSLQCRDCLSASDPIRRLMPEEEWVDKQVRAAAADLREREQREWVPDTTEDQWTGIFPDPLQFKDLILGPLQREHADAGIAPGCVAGPHGCTIRRYDKIGPLEARHKYGCPNERR